MKQQASKKYCTWNKNVGMKTQELRYAKCIFCKRTCRQLR